MKISGVYKITNTATGDFYVGSSKDVKSRWACHKCQSTWEKCPNNPMYQDMQNYGVDKFEFQILAEVEADKLKEAEQRFIETLKPTYNNRNANGLDIERQKKYNKEYQKEYRKSDKCKEYQKDYQKDYQKEYRKSDKCKEYQKDYQKEYRKSDKCKEYQKDYQKEYRKSDKCKEYNKEYNNQLCFYNGETLTLNALSMRFRRQGLSNPTLEAKKYLLDTNPIEFYDVYP